VEKKVEAQCFGRGAAVLVGQWRLVVCDKIENIGQGIAGWVHLLFEFGHGAKFDEGVEEDLDKP